MTAMGIWTNFGKVDQLHSRYFIMAPKGQDLVSPFHPNPSACMSHGLGVPLEFKGEKLR